MRAPAAWFPIPAAAEWFVDSHGRSVKFLMLAPSLPYPPHWAAGIRRFEFLNHLARRHDVSLLTYIERGSEADIAALEARGISVLGVPEPDQGRPSRRRSQLASLASAGSFQRKSLYTAEMQRELQRVVRERAIDTVMVETCHLSGFDPGPGVTVVLDEHNIEYELLYRGFRTESGVARKLFNLVESLKVRREEVAAWKRSAACLVHSRREQDIVRQLMPQAMTAVVTNGVHLDEFRDDGSAIEEDSLVFTGTMNFRPNTDAVTFFVREVLPLVLQRKPRAKFYAVGVGPPPEVMALAGPNVEVTGRVPDIKPYLSRAAAYVAPVRFGSGTRIKVIEALAMEKAVVSTALGCEGHDQLRPGTHFLAAEGPRQFADAIVRILDDRALAIRLGRAGRAVIEAEYSWPVLLDRMERFVAGLRPATASGSREPALA